MHNLCFSKMGFDHKNEVSPFIAGNDVSISMATSLLLTSLLQLILLTLRRGLL